ncbi:MAG: hypothetical protein LBD23_13730 [Oscillospiraceae bacterium]|jgi:N-acetylglucosamine kinase-like BadF-type ATPase|nr:hypothetical protein [Oscillospiraceae bacterium]
MSKFILGVDGGGTKSHVAVFDDKGNCKTAFATGPLNHEAMKGSYDELEMHLGEMIARTLKDIGATVSDIAFAVFGLAGVDTDAQQVLISDMVSKIGIKEHIMCNDAFLGVPAGCPDCVGVCAINGTGFKLAAVDHSDNAVQICGLGSFTDDLGGGSWYGYRAIGTVYNELYKLGQKTIMREMLFDMLDISRREDYMEVFTEKLYGGKLDHIALNSTPFNAAALGDTVAIKILDESAAQYAGGIARLIMDMDFPVDKPVHVTLAGSVFVKQKVRVLQELIEKRVSEALGGRPMIYNRLDTSPVVGAAMWAAQKAGFNIDISSVKSSLKEAGL